MINMMIDLRLEAENLKVAYELLPETVYRVVGETVNYRVDKIIAANASDGFIFTFSIITESPALQDQVKVMASRAKSASELMEEEAQRIFPDNPNLQKMFKEYTETGELPTPQSGRRRDKNG